MLLFAAARGISTLKHTLGTYVFAEIRITKSGMVYDMTAGSIMTAISRTAYFKCLRGFIFSVENFLDGILCSSS